MRGNSLGSGSRFKGVGINIKIRPSEIIPATSLWNEVYIRQEQRPAISQHAVITAEWIRSETSFKLEGPKTVREGVLYTPRLGVPLTVREWKYIPEVEKRFDDSTCSQVQPQGRIKVRHAIHETFLRQELGDLLQHHLKQIQPLQSPEFSDPIRTNESTTAKIEDKRFGSVGNYPALTLRNSILVVFTCSTQPRGTRGYSVIASAVLYSGIALGFIRLQIKERAKGADSQYIRRESTRSERINLRHVLPASLIIYILFRSSRFCFHSETLISGLQVIHISQMVVVRAFSRL
jgi:hypothetical protein